MNEQKPKIFISHSWEDIEISRKLADNLRRDGAEVWIDTSRISGGDTLPDTIGEGIAWCEVFLLIWSKSAKISRYVTLERNCAVDIGKRIIPCIIDTEQVPTILTAFLRIDFKNFEQGYQTLARDLFKKIFPYEDFSIELEKYKEKFSLVPSKGALIFRNDSLNPIIFDIYYGFSSGAGYYRSFSLKSDPSEDDSQTFTVGIEQISYIEILEKKREKGASTWHLKIKLATLDNKFSIWYTTLEFSGVVRGVILKDGLKLESTIELEKVEKILLKW